MSTKTADARRLRVGITVGIHHARETLWNNGIKQNAVFLAETLKRCPCVASVCLLNMTGLPVREGVAWDVRRWPTFSFDDAKDDVDVVIELGGQVAPDQTEHLKQRGARLVSYCCGFEYVHAMEAVLFGTGSISEQLFVNQRYDAIWMIPQVAAISRPYFTTLRRRPARVVPFVWDPVFLDERCRDFPNRGEYRPGGAAKRLTVMEPNINVVKFCLYPVMIADEAYRRRADLVSFLHVTNAERLAKESADFVSLMFHLDIVKAHKAAFVGRFETPQFLAEMTDVVISHQWENALNYFYLEVCWQGYPLVHNAHLVRDLGYYYRGNDVQAGASQLLHAMQAHDPAREDYVRRQRQLIGRFLPHNPQVVAEYDALLENLMRTPPT